MLLGARDALFTRQPLPRPGRTFLPALRSCGLLAPSSQACFLGAGSSSAPRAAPVFQRMGFLGVFLSRGLCSSSRGGLCPRSSVRRQNRAVSARAGAGNAAGRVPGAVRQPGSQRQAAASPGTGTPPRASVLSHADLSPSDKPALLSLAFKPLPAPPHPAMHRTGTGVLAPEQRQE